jgi:hypothetical protein
LSQAGCYDEKAAITLMSTDTDRLTSSLQSLCEIWANFIELVIGIVLLGLQLGWVCIAPIIVVAGMFCHSKSRYSIHVIISNDIPIWESGQAHRSKAKRVGQSDTTQSRDNIFHAWVNEKC